MPLFQITLQRGVDETSINERDFMGKKRQSCANDNINDSANICLSSPMSAFAGGNLHYFSWPREFTTPDLREISSPDFSYLILPKYVTNFFPPRLMMWRLCDRN
jgi:hypothetical protein